MKNIETFLYSNADKKRKNKSKRYIIEKIAHPHEHSDFEKSIGLFSFVLRIPVIKDMASNLAISYLRYKNYDSLFLSLDEEIIGHTAFQIHSDGLHAFSSEVKEEHRGKGLARYMAEQLINEARQKNIKRIRIGAGKHEAGRRIYTNLSKREDELKVTSLGNYWLEIL